MKYDFTGLFNNEFVEYDFTPSTRVSVINFAKKNNLKVSTRRIGDKLRVYSERQTG
jgi:hypothetical protein